MSLLDRVRAVQKRSPDAFTSLAIGEIQVGFVATTLADELVREFADYFNTDQNGLVLFSSLRGFDSRSKAFADVAPYLLKNGWMAKPRGELYPIKNHWNQTPFAALERTASFPFGLITYGVNLHAWTKDEHGKTLLWVGKRALTKPTEPGKLDHIAAGGQPIKLGLHENMVKEAGEEAGIPYELATQCRFTGSVSGHYHGDLCRRFIHYNFDLELPPEFQPQPMDGEVENFRLMSPDEVIELLRSGYHFDLETAIAIIDWLIRHGFIHAENEPDFEEIYAGMRADLFNL
jgi:hypothetical protein